MSQTAPAPDVVVSHVTSKDDFPNLVTVEERAFTVSPLMNLMFPPSPEANGEPPELQVRNHQKAWSTDPTARYLKASLSDGTIIGMAKWNFFLDPTVPHNPWKIELPPHVNRELHEYYFGGLDSARNEAMVGKKYILMAILCVSPEYQRMGVGGKLLDWGLKEADREGLECWIDSSPFGLGLYKKFGWKEVGNLDIELGRWGGEQGIVRRTVHMVRQPAR